MKEFDLIVIGGGSAGLKAARTAARLGRSVAIAEEIQLGGECFWAGCVPTKAMVRAAGVWKLVESAGQFGIKTGKLSRSFAGAMAYKDRVVKTVGGDGPPDAGLSKLGASYFHTHARFESPNEVRMGDTVASARQIVVATGTVPAIPDIPGLAAAGYITNREAVDLTALPKRLVILGGGPIGLEFAQIFARFGSHVTVLDHGPQVLPREDHDIANLAAGFLREEGIDVRLRAATESVGVGPGGKLVTMHTGDNRETVECDEILVATGRRPAVKGLNIEVTGAVLEKKCLRVDKYLRTTAPHIWAAGDVGGGYLFTHVASYEGRLVATNAFTDAPEPFDHRVVPRCTFIDPEVASIGITEKTAHLQGFDVTIHSFEFKDLDRAIIHNEPRGVVKLVVDALDGQILGAHLVGPDASSIIAELAICMKNHLPVAAIANTMHAYPSFPEAVEAAAMS